MLSSEHHCAAIALNALCARGAGIPVEKEGQMDPYHRDFNL